MRHFWPSAIACALSMAFASALAALLFRAGLAAPAILVLVAGAVAFMMLVGRIRALCRVIAGFAAAIEAGDTTVSFDLGSPSTALGRTAAVMSRLLVSSRRRALELETRKLYYDRILRVLTHEMRNSLTPVISIAADMERRAGEYSQADIAEAASVIRGEGEGMRRFLESYYELTHLPEPEPEAIGAREFAENLRRLVEPQLRERGMEAGVVEYVVAKDMEMTVDVALLTRAVVNLVRNALDAVAGGGEPKVTVSIAGVSPETRITVADNGPGLPPAVAASLFQPFVTTKEGGAGIGLCLSRQIARAHGGDLTIRSTPRGATATITL